eukprot:768727-Hanusia_phi.AAC.1
MQRHGGKLFYFNNQSFKIYLFSWLSKLSGFVLLHPLLVKAEADDSAILVSPLRIFREGAFPYSQNGSPGVDISAICPFAPIPFGADPSRQAEQAFMREIAQGFQTRSQKTGPSMECKPLSAYTDDDCMRDFHPPSPTAPRPAPQRVPRDEAVIPVHARLEALYPKLPRDSLRVPAHLLPPVRPPRRPRHVLVYPPLQLRVQRARAPPDVPGDAAGLELPQPPHVRRPEDLGDGRAALAVHARQLRRRAVFEAVLGGLAAADDVELLAEGELAGREGGV